MLPLLEVWKAQVEHIGEISGALCASANHNQTEKTIVSAFPFQFMRNEY